MYFKYFIKIIVFYYFKNGIDGLTFDQLCESKELCIIVQKELQEFVRG